MDHPDVENAMRYGYPPFDDEEDEEEKEDMCEYYDNCGADEPCLANDDRCYGSSDCLFSSDGEFEEEREARFNPKINLVSTVNDFFGMMYAVHRLGGVR
jgi:hypothetical protein